MGSKFRPLYDKMYMKTEYLLLAMQSNKRIKERAKMIVPYSDFNKEYKEIVVPYWKKYGIKPNKKWYRVFSELSKHIDPRYIPHNILVTKVFPNLNSLIHSKTFQDKNYQDIYLKGFNQPMTLVRNISGIFSDGNYELITKEKALELCLNEDEFIVKPSIGTGSAEGIKVINSNEMDTNKLTRVFDEYGKDYIIQKLIKQHPKMSELHKQSINTIRIITFLCDQEIHILNAFLRIGSGNSRVDNFSKGGFACNINIDGTLSEFGLDNQYKWVKETENGIAFRDFAIPNYDKVVQMVKDAALKLTHFRVIGWDIAIDDSGRPLIIEYNLIPITSVDLPQNVCNNPYFGDFTERVLDEIFKNHK